MKSTYDNLGVQPLGKLHRTAYTPILIQNTEFYRPSQLQQLMERVAMMIDKQTLVAICMTLDVDVWSQKDEFLPSVACC